MKKSSSQAETYQLPLFGLPEADTTPPAPTPLPIVNSRQGVINNVEWSYSRRSALEQCARRYYNEYYGANKRKAKGDTNKVRLHLLKQLQSRYERAGAILHKAVATYLRKAQLGQQWDVDRLYGFARMILAADLAHSRAYLATGVIPETDAQYPPVMLREFYYRQPDAEAMYAEIEERMLTGLRAFATSDAFSAVRAAGCVPGAYIERAFRLSGFPCKATGVVDLAFWDGDTFVIVDWKLNQSSGSGDDSLQLATYALWAVQDVGCGPDRLRIYKAHLLSGDLVPFRIDADLLSAARARILQDAERMADLQAFTTEGVAEAFTPCLYPPVCASCAFEEDCYGC